MGRDDGPGYTQHGKVVDGVGWKQIGGSGGGGVEDG